jgi:CMP-N-acetylneuraminic acid synthetase
MTGTCVAFVFARAGSKGVVGKNIRPLNNKPLIAHAIECAKQCPSIDRVVVSTDDQQTADIAIEYGGEVPFLRPSELATDTSPEWLSWQHAVRCLQDKGEDVSRFVSLPATSPLRTVDDVEAAIALLDEATDAVLSCSPVKANPYYSMLRPTESGYVEKAFTPPLYTITGLAYVTRADYILSHSHLLESPRVRTHIVPEERSLDIDSEYDFHIGELLMREHSG